MKPYRDKQTVNLLRVITGSSGVNLDNYWESLESVLTGEYSHHVVKDRIQSVVNMILKNGEFAKSKAIHTKSNLDVMFHLKLENLQIDKKKNMFDNVKCFNSRANVFDNVSNVEIGSKANLFNNEKNVNIDSRANMFNNVRNDNNDLINKVRHLHI